MLPACSLTTVFPRAAHESPGSRHVQLYLCGIAIVQPTASSIWTDGQMDRRGRGVDVDLPAANRQPPTADIASAKYLAACVDAVEDHRHALGTCGRESSGMNARVRTPGVHCVLFLARGTTLTALWNPQKARVSKHTICSRHLPRARGAETLPASPLFVVLFGKA